MHETHDKPQSLLVAALFCTIIGIITYAGFDSGTAGQRARGVLVGSKMPAIQDEARQLLP